MVSLNASGPMVCIGLSDKILKDNGNIKVFTPWGKCANAFYMDSLLVNVRPIPSLIG